MTAQEHRTLSSKRVFQGKIFEVFVDRVRLPSGEEAEREVVRHPGAVGIVAIDRGRVLLVRQMRHAPGETMLEIPAGKLDVAGERPEVTAVRELEEETGHTCESVELLTSFYNSPGYSDELFRVYLAAGIRRIADPPSHDSGEPISIEWVDLGDAIARVTSGEVRDAKTIIGLLLVKLRADEGGRGAG